jgi:hypothetical protein
MKGFLAMCGIADVVLGDFPEPAATMETTESGSSSWRGAAVATAAASTTTAESTRPNPEHVKWTKQNRIAIGAILLAIETDLVSYVQYYKRASQVWNTLQEEFSNRDTDTCQAGLLALISTKQGL